MAKYWRFVKPVLFVTVLLLVVWRGFDIWRSSPDEAIAIRWPFIALACVAYGAAWLPSIWFWRWTMKSAGVKIPFWTVARAYYCGHLGKYVPGKALVPVIRAGLLQETSCPPKLAVVTVIYETLATMGVGGAIAIALAPFASSTSLWARLPLSIQALRSSPWILPVIVVALIILSSRLIVWGLDGLANRLMKGASRTIPKYSTRSLLLGLVVLSLGWCLMAISLGCVLQGLGHSPTSLADFPTWLAASTLSVVAGFVVLIAPGGLGIREELLTEILRNNLTFGPRHAIVAAWLMRGVSLATELVVACVLYFWHRSPQTQPDSTTTAK